MHYVAPTRAVVRFRCEPASAVRLSSLGVEVFESDNGPIAQYPCAVDGELFVQAAARCEAQRVDGLLIADLSAGASFLEDRNPSRRDSFDYHGNPEAWRPPELTKVALTPVRLPGKFELADLPEVLVRWLLQVPELEPGAYEEALRAWTDRMLEIEALAQERVESVKHLVNSEEATQFDRALSDIRRVILYGTDPEWDLTGDDMGGAWVPPPSVIVNEQFRRVLELADQIEKAREERQRRKRYQSQIEGLVEEWRYRLSPRLQMAIDAGLLEQSTGIARAELLTLLRPGWEWAKDEIKEAVNPSEEALRALLLAQRNFNAGTCLGYVSTGRRSGRYVLVSEFLGRTIVGELDKVELEVPLDADS